MQKSGSKIGSKGVAKNGGTSGSRGASASRSHWARGGNGGRSSGGSSRSWFSGGGSRWGSGLDGSASETQWDRADGGPGERLGRALGEGLASGLGDEIGEGLGASGESAAFWRGVAACALVVAVIVLVLQLGG